MTSVTRPPGGADTLAPTPISTTPSVSQKPAFKAFEEKSPSEPKIRPFAFRATDDQLGDLKQRIETTRWPERELVDDGAQGVQLELMQKLADYWANQYDWRRCEAQLNALLNFITVGCFWTGWGLLS